jgi:phosphonate transport system ATP-binding protein
MRTMIPSKVSDVRSVSLSTKVSTESSTEADNPVKAPIFELVNVGRSFGAFQALSNINLTIHARERVALVGPSGAGKSTIINLLNGTLLPSQGETRILGQNLATLSPRAARRIQQQIGTIYQQFHLVDNLQVIHNVNAGHLGRWSLMRAALSLIWPQAVTQAAQALTRVGIPEKLYARTDQLSGGQQQRVALARVLVQDPAAILADEPISNVDPERSRGIMDLLRQLCQQTDKTLVVSLHLIEYARSHCDRIVGLRHGELLFDAPSSQISQEMIDALYRIE